MPTIPPLFENGESVVDYPTKAETFNNYFVSHCTPSMQETRCLICHQGHPMASFLLHLPSRTPHGLLSITFAIKDTPWPPFYYICHQGHPMASFLLHLSSRTPHGLLSITFAIKDTPWPPFYYIFTGKNLNVIRALDSNISSGWDGVSPRMIKICDSSIVNP